ncbi:MAG: hypothetical protein DWQ36_07725 [Acidobacteria bacterium]|nr:MAG: hypothetical protein DWQ30_04100 [Acidobacteriota bacterium]REK08856.1 MAG: hypothetical protein DWQ36_07725 [Acidobacteriota bacterium]
MPMLLYLVPGLLLTVAAAAAWRDPRWRRAAWLPLFVLALAYQGLLVASALTAAWWRLPAPQGPLERLALLSVAALSIGAPLVLRPADPRRRADAVSAAKR